MKLNDKAKLYINRIITAGIGGLLVFAVMSVSVVRDANERIDQLSEELDTSRNEASRLLADAEAQLENNDYDEARASLEQLFDNQPGSDEAEEGEALMDTIDEEEATADAQWESSEEAVRERWTSQLVEEMRAELEADRAEMEEDLEETVSEAWDDAREEVRDEWREEWEAERE